MVGGFFYFLLCAGLKALVEGRYPLTLSWLALPATLVFALRNGMETEIDTDTAFSEVQIIVLVCFCPRGISK